jgi:hypothetical protein
MTSKWSDRRRGLLGNSKSQRTSVCARRVVIEWPHVLRDDQVALFVTNVGGILPDTKEGVVTGEYQTPKTRRSALERISNQIFRVSLYLAQAGSRRVRTDISITIRHNVGLHPHPGSTISQRAVSRENFWRCPNSWAIGRYEVRNESKVSSRGTSPTTMVATRAASLRVATGSGTCSRTWDKTATSKVRSSLGILTPSKTSIPSKPRPRASFAADSAIS